MPKTNLLSKQHLKMMKKTVDATLAQVGSSFKCSWEPAQGRRKVGIPNYSSPVHDITVLIRSAEEARRSDALLGVTLTGTHMGIAERDNKFTVGDTLIRNNGDVFEILGVQRYAGDLYWILDLGIEAADPAKLP